MKTTFFTLLFTLVAFLLQAQSNLQNIRGTVIDKLSQSPITGATLVITNSNPSKGAQSDVNGKFIISDVAPGRYEIKVSYMGYKELTIPNVMVTSGKETILDLNMEENIRQLKGATIKSHTKNRTQNEMVSVSGRTFSMEEVNRYAGGRSDPARLAANFAGVSSPDDSRNDIVIRGNSPTGVLWRIEGLNIPNPNHFATVGTTGGPVSALNTNMLKNSDFFTSAFPAEYGNANAGVFDINFRKGNADKREHTIQFGMLTGMEAMTEGPIKKGNGSSYLLAYRYSFTGVAQALGIPIGTTATPFYQDLSFKINSGDGKLGRFTLFGIGGKSNIKFLHDKIDTTDLFADPSADSYFTSDIALAGLKHFIKVSPKSYINTIIGATYSASDYNQDTISHLDDSPARVVENKTKRLTYTLNSAFNSKISSRLFIKAGIQAEIMNLNLDYRTRNNSTNWKQIWDFKDYTYLMQAFAQAKYNFSEKLTLNLGLHSQFLTLNNASSIEPRAGLRYAITEKSTLSAGFGLHSQMQPTDVYFYRDRLPDGSYDQSNLDLGFTRSQHYVIGYDVTPIKDWRIKVEVYYQRLSNVPVTVANSSYSMLNNGASFNPSNQGFLVNRGTGRNYGIELTVEKFYSRGYYGLMTATLYESKYTGSDGVERNTAFNGNYVFNILGGKEFKIGKAKRNNFFTDLKLTSAGGRYFTPVDLPASQLAGEQVLKGDEYAFSERNPDFFRLDFKSGITINSKKRKLSHSFYIDIQNITNHKNVFAQRYNPINNSINTAYQIGLFPNFVYKLQF
ncbi:MAG: TonB-dependent receptor [Chitinophagaceae bacterium]|nr:TonB-dependent receptor [Chitinophagaceae bacterium]